MKFAILGATGPTGLQLVDECLDKGHTVVALVRNPDKLTTTRENLTVHKVDVLEESDLLPHFKGCDAVFSCLGGLPGFWTPCSIYTDSIRTITEAMRKADVTRFVGMTAWGTKYDDGLSWFIKWVLRPILLRNVLANMLEMEDFLTEKCRDLDFTIVRPPGLTNFEPSGLEVLTAEDVLVHNASRKIPRRDVASFMLQCVVKDAWKMKCVAVALPLPPTS